MSEPPELTMAHPTCAKVRQPNQQQEAILRKFLGHLVIHRDGSPATYFPRGEKATLSASGECVPIYTDDTPADTHISETFNEYGTPVSMFRCVGCERAFTVCPAVPEEKRDQWSGCMGSECSTYDEKRDGDKLFGEGKVYRTGDRSHLKCVTDD